MADATIESHAEEEGRIGTRCCGAEPPATPHWIYCPERPQKAPTVPAVRHCEARLTRYRTCRQVVGLRHFEGSDGEQHAYCAVPYHHAQVERRFGVAVRAAD